MVHTLPPRSANLSHDTLYPHVTLLLVLPYRRGRLLGSEGTQTELLALRL